MSKNEFNKRGPKPHKRQKVVLALRKHKRATSRQLKVTTAYMDTLVQAGIVRVVGVAEPKGGRAKKGRGRKASLFALTPAGNGKATALLRQTA